jgi:hypothetical protein
MREGEGRGVITARIDRPFALGPFALGPFALGHTHQWKLR